MGKLSTANSSASKSNRVLACARVSSKEQDMEGFSIAAQQKLLQAYLCFREKLAGMRRKSCLKPWAAD